MRQRERNIREQRLDHKQMIITGKANVMPPEAHVHLSLP